MKATDFLRQIGWGIVSFIFNLIDTLFGILKELNAYDIINSVAENSMFSNFHKGIIAMAITLLGLFAIFKFVMKVIEPEEGLTMQQIVTEILKASLFVLLSVFLFAEVSTFSIKLSGFTANIFNSNDITLSDSMLTMYVDYSDKYKANDDFKEDNYQDAIKDNSFTEAEMYNDKFVTDKRAILPDKKAYKYKINWILSIIVGGFFLYALFFSGMMLARRQIEFLFLFIISPVVFATSVGNKQRRSAVIEQLVSLMLQGAVVMLIINLTAIVAEAVDSTVFFQNDSVKDLVLKSLMYVGCGTFLLTGSQVVNRFIGGNVSANSGREQLMSLMGFSQTMGNAAGMVGSAGIGAGMVGLGVAASAVGRAGGNYAMKKLGGAISSFGTKISNNAGNPNSALGKIGNFISNAGAKIGQATPSSVGKNLRHRGASNIKGSVNSLMPHRTMYRNRYRER